MRILVVIVPPKNIPNGADDATFEQVVQAIYAIHDGGSEAVLASPGGGSPWTRRQSEASDLRGAVAARFRADRNTRDALADTLSFDQVFAEDFDGALCIGQSTVLLRTDHEDQLDTIITDLLADGKSIIIIRHAIEPSCYDTFFSTYPGSKNLALCAAGTLLELAEDRKYNIS